jgi:hypothetical protein
MGKASSSKKVARAARAAGRPGTGRSFGWPLLIGAVVVLGLVLVVVSRGKTEDTVPPELGDHWHAAYGIYDCDAFIAPLTDIKQDETGLHTHGDGLMHMHPFGTKYTGKGANLRNWGETTGLLLTDHSVKAAGIDRTDGDSCGDAGKGKVQLMTWDSPDDDEGTLITENLAKYNPQEFSVFTIAFVPEGTEIPKPPQEVLDALRAPADVVGGNQGSTTTIPIDDGSSTTVPAGTETTASTAPTDSTETTTAPPATTATTATP